MLNTSLKLDPIVLVRIRELKARVLSEAESAAQSIFDSMMPQLLNELKNLLKDDQALIIGNGLAFIEENEKQVSATGSAWSRFKEDDDLDEIAEFGYNEEIRVGFKLPLVITKH